MHFLGVWSLSGATLELAPFPPQFCSLSGVESEHFLGQELSSILPLFPPQLLGVWRGGSGGSGGVSGGALEGDLGDPGSRGRGRLGEPGSWIQDPLPTNVYDLGRITEKCQKGDQPFYPGPKAISLGFQTGSAVRNRIFSMRVTRRMDFPKSAHFSPSREGGNRGLEGWFWGVWRGFWGVFGGGSGGVWRGIWG